MEASKKEWVNSERTTLALVVLGVNPLFLGGLHIKYYLNSYNSMQLFICTIDDRVQINSTEPN